MSERVRRLNEEEVRERMDQIDEFRERAGEKAEEAILRGEKKLTVDVPELTGGIVRSHFAAKVENEPVEIGIGRSASRLLERGDDLLVNLGNGARSLFTRDFEERLSTPIPRKNYRTAVVAGAIVTSLTVGGVIATPPAMATEGAITAEEPERIESEELPQEFEISFGRAQRPEKDENQGRDMSDEQVAIDTTGSTEPEATDSGDTSTEGSALSSYVVVKPASGDLAPPQLADDDAQAIGVHFTNQDEQVKGDSADQSDNTNSSQAAAPEATEETEPATESELIGETVSEDVIENPVVVVFPDTPITETIEESIVEEIPSEVVPEIDQPAPEASPVVSDEPIVAEVAPISESATEESVVVVEEGDTLSEFAKKHGETVEQLAARNGIADPDKIYIGDELLVPNPDNLVIVQLGQTLSEIAKANNTTARELGRLNDIHNINWILEGQKIILPGAVEKIVVEEGQTLSALSIEYEIPVEEIVKANDIENEDSILSGQVISIPVVNLDEPTDIKEASNEETNLAEESSEPEALVEEAVKSPITDVEIVEEIKEELAPTESSEDVDDKKVEELSFEQRATEQKERFLNNLSKDVNGVPVERVLELFKLLHEGAMNRGLHITDEGYVAAITHAIGESSIRPTARGGAGEGGIWQWKGSRANGPDGKPADLSTLESNVDHFFYDASIDSNFLEDIQNPDLDLHDMVTEGYRYERPSSWFDPKALAPDPPLKERSENDQAGTFRWGIAEKIWKDLTN